MPEYIEREKLITRLENSPLLSNEWVKEAIVDLVKKQPTADVQEVVRCKNCKYFEIDEEDELGECKCGYMVVSYNGELYPRRNNFCNYGAKMDKE